MTNIHLQPNHGYPDLPQTPDPGIHKAFSIAIDTANNMELQYISVYRQLLFIIIISCCFFYSSCKAPESESQASVPLLETELIFPIQNEHTHGSTIVELPNGDLLAGWFQGSGERWADDVRIMGSRKKKNQVTWSEPFVLADIKEFPDCNPVLFIDGKDRLWLMWMTIIANQWETALLVYRISDDYLGMEGAPDWKWQENLLLKPGGRTERGIQPDDPFVASVKNQIEDYSVYVKTDPEKSIYYERWSQHAERILSLAKGENMIRAGRISELDGQYDEVQLGYPYFRRMGWQTANKPFITATGRMIVPLYSDGFSISIMALTDDWGENWKTSSPVVGSGNIQPAIAQKKSGELVAYMRDNGFPPKRLHMSSSKDNGETWSSVRDSDIPNPGTLCDLVTLENGNWILINNDTETGRHRLTVSLSEDEGKTWPWIKPLADDLTTRSHYPAIIVGKDGLFHVTYSYFQEDNNKTIKYARFNEAWIRSENKESSDIRHLKVYYEPGRFGGWPANHGIWSWGDEILVGFCAAYYMDKGGFHAVDPAKPEHHLLARSLDGGETWNLEFPEKQKALLPRGAMLFGTPLPDVEYPPITDLKESINFIDPDFAMTFRMEDHRGKGQSRFYYSYDRGKNWKGPFALPLFNTPGIAARTDYLVEGKNEMIVFLTAGKSDGTEGRTLCVKTIDGGLNWEFLSWIGPETEVFRIMPSSVRLTDNEILTTVRKREAERRLIKAWISKDNGKNWEFLTDVAPDVGVGSPPGLIKLRDGRLCITYAHRGEPYGMRARVSKDNGKSWSEPLILRDDGGNWDIGYPRSVQRSDGKVVVIYYFWDKQTGPERYIAATIFDPDKCF